MAGWAGGNKKHKVPAAWGKAYPHANFKVITPNNYLDWITSETKK